ncbi:photosystem I assembly protein Ycf3 [Poriferisphaera corsica]|uniref:Photosystem I assembly protein Ycf3 n=1 Tax=Poriferisphaera corsica TaxID=2528020 RepID=A0A517YWL0_9BACT|nr:tetratricopeptide repeat protein [Poriferisphaera corsica]QDU34599.1 photosystem I assembly protein Ycf3 [Poriferisphaera corsica]
MNRSTVFWKRGVLVCALCGVVIVMGMSVGCVASQEEREEARLLASAERRADEAEQYMAMGYIDTALAEFGMALEENPDLIEAHMGMGDVYREIGNYELAKRAYTRATKVDPNHFDAQYSLAVMHHLLSEFGEAVKVYLRALAIEPSSFVANRDIAGAYMQMEQPEIALRYAKRATELDTEHQEAWTNLASIYAMMKEYRKAIDCYREAAELGDLNERVLLGLGDAHIHLGNYKRAITVLETYTLREQSSTAHERMGYAYFKSKRFVKALGHYRKALVIDENDTAAMNGIGACLMTRYIQEGRENKLWRDEAAEMWRKSLKIRPVQPHIADLLSRYNRM